MAVSPSPWWWRLGLLAAVTCDVVVVVASGCGCVAIVVAARSSCGCDVVAVVAADCGCVAVVVAARSSCGCDVVAVVAAGCGCVDVVVVGSFLFRPTCFFSWPISQTTVSLNFGGATAGMYTRKESDTRNLHQTSLNSSASKGTLWCLALSSFTAFLYLAAASFLRLKKLG